MRKLKIPLTEELSFKILALFNDGMGARKIADALKISRSHIRLLMKQLNLAHPKGYVNPQPKEVGTTQKCRKCLMIMSIKNFAIGTNKKPIARCKKCSSEDNSERHKKKLKRIGKKTRPKNNSPILSEELDTIRELHEQRLTRKEIGAILNRSGVRIGKAFKELGLVGWHGNPKRVSREERLQNARDRWEKDIFYKLRRLVSTAINMALHRQNGGKFGGSTIDYLPYTIPELKSHIESLFEPWMTWDNHGRMTTEIAKNWNEENNATWIWNLDHITPQSDLPYDSMEHHNFLKCWELSNLRPLNAKTNLIDGSKRIRHKK